MPRKIKSRVQLAGWIESLVITALFIAASVFLKDPMSLHSSFPWIWFAPVLIALRYGLWPSLMSILFLLSFYLYQSPQQIYSIPFQLFLLGGFLLTVSCVIYNGVLSSKMNESDKVSRYLQKRIQALAYSYETLLLAYQRLEQNFITKPVTIRSSLVELRELLARSDKSDQESILHRFLNILGLNCSIGTAAIYPVKKNKVLPETISSIGQMKPLKTNDFLIKESLQTTTILHATVSEILKGHVSDYLVAAPLIDQENKTYALLVVEEMPFLSLNNENLGTMNILLQYFVEGKTVKKADLIIKRYPDCPVDFANELQRLKNLQQATNGDSAIACFIFMPGPHQDDYLYKLKHEKRGIDTFWETADGDRKMLYIIMPFSSRAAVESYTIRIDDILTRDFNIKLNEEGIKFKSNQLSSFNNPIDLIEDLKNTK